MAAAAAACAFRTASNTFHCSWVGSPGDAHARAVRPVPVGDHPQFEAGRHRRAPGGGVWTPRWAGIPTADSSGPDSYLRVGPHAERALIAVPRAMISCSTAAAISTPEAPTPAIARSLQFRAGDLAGDANPGDLIGRLSAPLGLEEDEMSTSFGAIERGAVDSWVRAAGTCDSPHSRKAPPLRIRFVPDPLPAFPRAAWERISRTAEPGPPAHRGRRTGNMPDPPPITTDWLRFVACGWRTRAFPAREDEHARADHRPEPARKRNVLGNRTTSASDALSLHGAPGPSSLCWFSSPLRVARADEPGQQVIAPRCRSWSVHVVDSSDANHTVARRDILRLPDAF